MLPVFLDIDPRNNHVSRIAVNELKQAWVVHGGEIANPNIPSRIERLLLRKSSKIEDSSENFFVPLMSPHITNYPRKFLKQKKTIYLFCWDVFPSNRNEWLDVFKRLNPKVIFLTSSDSIALFSDFKDYKFELIPEAITVENFIGTKLLKERQIDILEFGRRWNKLHEALRDIAMKLSLLHIYPKENELLFKSTEDFVDGLRNSKVIVCTPGSWSHPSSLDRYNGVELLTRRYLEAMAAGAILVGHCPRDLEKIMNINPVIEISDPEAQVEVIEDLFSNLEFLQEKVDANLEWTRINGDWALRVKTLEEIIMKNT